MRWEWTIVEDPEPDPVIDAWLDYMSQLGKIADTYALYAGPAAGRKRQTGGAHPACLSRATCGPPTDLRKRNA